MTNNQSKSIPYIIAEAGVNHNGSLATAITMIDAANKAGVDAIKFQLFEPELLATQSVPMAEYQVRNSDKSVDCNSQLTMLKSLALSHQDHLELYQYCTESDIDYLCSPFDSKSAEFLTNGIKLKTIKIGSGEITNGPLLWQLANANIDIILSTGMSTLSEIHDALTVIAMGYLSESFDKFKITHNQQTNLSETHYAILKSKVTLLHCTSEYPCPFEDINLLAMDTLAETFKLPVGLSDHSGGISVSLAAIGKGATIIEKHFTLNRNLPGPDHKASLVQEELNQLVKEARHVYAALGSRDKIPVNSELETQKVARKHLVAATAIAKGEIFSAINVTAKRSMSGLSPMNYWQLLGKTAIKNFQADDIIEL